MTLTTTTNVVTQIGNGVTTQWPFTFRIPSDADLNVGLFEIATNTLTPLASSDYSVTGINNDAGGEVTYPLVGPPIASTHRLVIWRDVPLTQDIDLTNQSPYYSETMEDQLDRIVMQIQQLSEESDRSIKVTLGSTLDPDAFIADLQAAEKNAADSAAEAAASAASASTQVLPDPAVALNYPRRNVGNTAYENRTPVEVAADISAVRYDAATALTENQQIQARENIGAASTIDTRRNRMVNGDMRVSQENGTTAGTTNGRYPVDQWAQYFVTSAGTLTVAQVASVTPAGSPNRIRATVTVADATLAAGEYWTISQNLEGSNVADFQYGGSAAKASVLRFGFKGPAGTYAVHIGNSAADRSFVALFTIAAPDANTDTVQTIAITGDTTGTWLTTDGVIGLTLEIVLACGTTFQGAAGWQSGNILGTSAVSNGMGTGSAVFELFDVGLKLDPDATGVYGAYEVGETDAVFRPERYLEQNSYGGTTFMSSGLISGAAAGATWYFAVQKAKDPTVSVVSGVWTGTTPTAQPKREQVYFISNAGFFQLSGAANNVALRALARLS